MVACGSSDMVGQGTGVDRGSGAPCLSVDDPSKLFLSYGHRQARSTLGIEVVLVFGETVKIDLGSRRWILVQAQGDPGMQSVKSLSGVWIVDVKGLRVSPHEVPRDLDL